MKRVCAWCGRELDHDDGREDVPVTHGLCPPCRLRFFHTSRPPDAPSREAQAGAAAPMSVRPRDC